jgi:hypothetical protein
MKILVISGTGRVILHGEFEFMPGEPRAEPA